MFGIDKKSLLIIAILSMIAIGMFFYDSYNKFYLYYEDINKAATIDNYYLSSNYKEILTDTCASISFDKFYGVKTLYRINVKKDAVLNLMGEDDSTYFKFIMVDKNKKVIDNYKFNKHFNYYNLEIRLNKGIYYLKMVGNKDLYNTRLRIFHNDDIEVTPFI